MLGDLMGQMENMQQQMQEELAKISVDAEAGDGAVRVSADGLRTITNISIDTSKIELSDSEQLEDLLMVAINRALELAAEEEQTKSQAMMQNMLPPGMGGLFGM